MIKRHPKRFRPGRAVLWAFLNHHHPDEVLGDYEEIREEIARSRGRLIAGAWWAGQILMAVPIYCRNAASWGFFMTSNYLKIAWRTARRHKGYTFLNLAGLAAGLACCILILLWIQDETSFDRFHRHADRLFRVGRLSPSKDFPKSPRVAYPLAGAILDEIPEVENAARFFTASTFIRREETNFTNIAAAYAEPSFLRMFSFAFIEGDPASALDGRSSVVVSRSLAARLFGRSPAVGRLLNLGNVLDVRVTGVIKDVPGNSHFRFDCLLPFEARNEYLKKKAGDDNWRLKLFDTYLFLGPTADPAALGPKITSLVKRRFPESDNAYFVQAVTDVHLHPLDGEGNTKYLRIFAVLAVFVLGISCINFMNLATARAGNRAKEIGLRKVVGAGRADLVRQFLGESVFMSFLAVLAATGLALACLPLFNALSGKDIGFEVVRRGPFLTGILGLGLLAGLLSGSYPALFLSSLAPDQAFRSFHRTGRRAGSFRRLLVVFQFAVAIFLISGTIVIRGQLSYMRGADMGFDKEHLLFFPFQATKFEAFKNELSANPRILGVTRGNPPVEFDIWAPDVSWEGKKPDQDVTFKITPVGFDYTATMKIKLVQGRDFSPARPSDLIGGFLVNEEAVRVMGMDAPIGRTLRVYGMEGRIIGVVGNFHDGSLHKAIYPVIFKLDPAEAFMVSIRISPDDTAGTLAFIERLWKSHVPGYPFEYVFLDDLIGRFYRVEERMGGLFSVFTVLAVFISGLGLFGLASYAAEQKTKEIGIRKVLGAPVPGIVWHFSRPFFAWVAAAGLVAFPLAEWVLRGWLRNFAFRVALRPAIFVLAGALALGIALVAVGAQSLRAALADPADSLKYE